MLARAEAEAKAQELLRKTISPEIVYLRAVEKWDGKQPTIVGEGGAILDLGQIKKGADQRWSFTRLASLGSNNS